MDLRLFIAWEWFQWVAIRLALFLALLTLGPSIGLLVFDVLLYAYRTTFGNVPFLGGRKSDVIIEETREELIVTGVEVNEKEVEVVN